MALALAADPYELCRHDRYGYATLACVPAGFICDDCKRFVMQWLPESPEVLGYLSAEWAWHHRDGKAWTTLTERGQR